MAMFRDLPKDLVEEEILCHVPATYLKRLILTFNGDSRFARIHTEKAAKQFLVLLMNEYRICPTIFNLLNRSVEFKSELSLVDAQSMCSAQFDIARAFHCDGLLFCASEDQSRFVVWNPLTGETRWFQSSYRGVRARQLAFGYYQEDNDKRYKILSFSSKGGCEIYDFSSDSWRTLHDILPPSWGFIDLTRAVSLKGNTYCLTDTQSNTSLLKFDFQTEEFVPLSLPYQCPDFIESTGLSVVREEKLSVLLQRDVTCKIEIWVTNKIDETTTQVVSWSKVLALDLSPDLQISDDVNFLLDEEKKVVMMALRWLDPRSIPMEKHPDGKNMIYIVGEDDEVTQVELGTDDRCYTFILNYVPSLVQIEQAGRKRKRGKICKM